MDKKELTEILRLHKMWLNGDKEGKLADLREADLREAGLRGANLRYASLQDADLQGANLRGASLQDADLQGANLRGANLDYSCWPLWCGSLDVKVDRRIAAQLAYHFCRLDCDDPDYISARNAVINFANEFHRVEECGWLELREVNPVG